MKDAMTYASEAGFFSFNVVGWRAEFERLIEAVRADVLAEQPASQEYQDHLVNQSFDWSAMAAKHQFMEGYRIGLAEMREKCATVVTEHAPTCSPNWVSYVAAIRAIKFEGDTGFRPVSEMVSDHFAASGKPIAEQEPVAYVYEKDVAGIGMRKDVAFTKHVEVGTDLYTAPVRTKDLTDDEIEALAEQFVGQQSIALCRAVIAFDREKNK